MSEQALIKPEIVKFSDGEEGEKTFILSNFPAIQGREIVTCYLASGLPKVADYPRNEETMFKLMQYVAVETDAGPLRLTTPELVNNHCTDWEMLGEIEFRMMQKNCRFFRDGKALRFFDRVTQMFTQKLSEMLTASSAQS